MDYRNLARTHLKNAEGELASKLDHRLKYAALELRMAMEALTYDRALAYKEEFPPSEYETWQPRKVMSILLEVDPMVDKDSAVAAGIEEQYGVPASKMESLGSEKVLGMETLRKHYDALGSFLHVPLMKHIREGKPLDFNKIRTRCEDIEVFIDQVLSSPIFNVIAGNVTTLDCIKCRQPIRKRIPFGQKEVIAECCKCKSTYSITDEGSGKANWMPNQYTLQCAKVGCVQTIKVWRHVLKEGYSWKCNKCNSVNALVLAVKCTENA